MTAAEVLLRRPAPLLGLRQVGHRLGILRGEFAQPLLVELDAALVPVNLAFQLQPALLLRADFVFQLRQPLAQLRNLVFAAQHAGRVGLDLVPEVVGRRLPLRNLSLQLVELMAGELGIEVLQFRGQLFVAARFARLALEGANLPLHLPHQVGHAQQVLLGVFELAQRLFLLRLVLGDPGRLLEDHPAVFRLAREDLRDVALGHDAVAGAAHPRAHEQLLDVFQPARRLVDEILAPAVPENPARHRHLVVSHLDARRRQVLVVHPANRQAKPPPCPSGLRPSVPLKITSAISPPRKALADCSPSTQRIASDTFDLPHPLGPTMAVTPG